MTRCAHRTARAVLPTPAVPLMAAIRMVAPLVASARSLSRTLSSAARPAKCGAVAGNCRGAPAGRSGPGGLAALSSSSRASPVSSKAAASIRIGLPYGAAVLARSMLPMARTLNPDLRASSSWDRPAAIRWPRSSAPRYS